MISCIYEGAVRHRRFIPVRNCFRYRIFMMYLDLAELPELLAPQWAWSLERFNVASFYRRDYLGRAAVPLEQAVRDTVRQHTGRSPAGPIRLLAHLRYLGYCFNPVCFYYCFDDDGRQLDTIVAEITNTPWGERHRYVLTRSDSEHPLPAWRRHCFGKQFHVSPFMGMELQYDWRFSVPGDSLRVYMVNLEQGQRLFDASLALERRPFSGPVRSRMLLTYPLMTLKVVAAIYLQALRLLNKKAPFFVHPGKRTRTTESSL